MHLTRTWMTNTLPLTGMQIKCANSRVLHSTQATDATRGSPHYHVPDFPVLVIFILILPPCESNAPQKLASLICSKLNGFPVRQIIGSNSIEKRQKYTIHLPLQKLRDNINRCCLFPQVARGRLCRILGHYTGKKGKLTCHS